MKPEAPILLIKPAQFRVPEILLKMYPGYRSILRQISQAAKSGPASLKLSSPLCVSFNFVFFPSSNNSKETKEFPG